MLNRLCGGVPGAELFPADEKTFFTPFSQVPLRGTFVQNQEGKTTGIVINLGARRLRGVRVGK
jgi:hypothetical protein